MLKGVLNLFLVFIICITAAGMPIDENTFNFSLIPSEESSNSITYSINPNNTSLINPTTVSLVIKSNQPIELTPEQANSFILDIFRESQKISSVKASSFIISQDSGPETALNLNISQQNLDLSNGDYIFQIYSQSKEFRDIDPLRINVIYKPVAPYMAALNNIDRGMMNLTLYLPNKGRQYLVPITRFVNHNRATLRTTINNLQEGSSILGFESPIPNIPRLQVTSDIVTVHLATDLGKYHDNEVDGYLALNSIVDSLTSIPGINKVKFLVNGRESDHIFYQYSTAAYFEPTKEIPKVFLGLDANSTRTLLVPVNMPTIKEGHLYLKMFDVLQTASLDGTSPLSNLIPTVPQNIQLISANSKDQTITLDLSKEFLYSYPDRTDLQKMLLDSIVYSYTSIKNIKQVQFLVENQVVESFGGVQLSKPLLRPKYINPEK